MEKAQQKLDFFDSLKPSPPGKVASEARRKRATSGKLQKYIDILESCMKNPAFMVRKVCKPSSAPVCALGHLPQRGRLNSVNSPFSDYTIFLRPVQAEKACPYGQAFEIR